MNKIFRTLNIESQVPKLADLGYKHLIVSGCSFTYNDSNEYCITWPYYLRDMAGFETVLDTSMPGAGNYHIANSLHWALEIDQPNPQESLVIVMWSGYDRDDLILPSTAIGNYPYRFNYSPTVGSGLTGGLHPKAVANIRNSLIIKPLASSKNKESRAIENFLIIDKMYHYLKSKGYKFIFLDYLDRTIPNLSTDFTIEEFLPNHLVKQLKDYKLNVENLYKFSMKQNLMSADEFHPDTEGHCQWVKNCLLPAIIKNKY